MVNPYEKERKGILRVLPQTGRIVSPPRDAARKARPPGKRLSATGKIYWEGRRSRSDLIGGQL